MFFNVITKPTGARCNLGCRYCFYLSKDTLYPGSDFRMTDQVLESFIRQMFESRPDGTVNLVWQGGEPTLMGLDFFRRAVELADRYRQPGQTVHHAIQTNGTLLNDAWAAFFKAHGFLVGLSIDGPEALHDAFRVHRNGAGSFSQVKRGWALLQRHGVETNILCAVHAANADHPLDVYRFFRDDLGARFLQFIPIVVRAAPGPVSEYSVRPEQFGRFLTAVFDEWVTRDVGQVFVQAFDVALAGWMGQHPLCIFAPTCGNAPALEHNGDLYSCDHFVEPVHLLGNILDTPLAGLVASEQQRQFGQAKADSLPRYCRECPVLFACHGGCPKNRFIHTPDGEPGLNYLCAGYRLFFTHINRPMQAMSAALRRRG